MQVRRKALSMDAVEFDGSLEHVQKLGGRVISDPTSKRRDEIIFVLDAVDGTKPFKKGDWVVSNSQGHKHLLSPEAFKATYEEVPKPAETF